MPFYSKTDMWALHCLFSEFADSSSYGIRHNAIEYIYLVNNKDFEAAHLSLQLDTQIRWKIRELHAMRDSTNDFSLNCQFHIDMLVEQRNIPLSIIDKMPGVKIFDLHWFSIYGAIQFVKKIHKILSESPKRVIESEEIILITGQNKRFPWSSTIKTWLLDIYGDTIRVDKKNAGRLILTIKKKMTYADFIF